MPSLSLPAWLYAPLKFEFREGEGPTIEGTLVTYDQPRVVEYQWGDDETLRFELEPDGDGTLLTFVNTFTELGNNRSADTTYGVHEHVRGDGRFTTTYTFGQGLASRHLSYWFQVASLPTGDYPFAPAKSRRRTRPGARYLTAAACCRSG